MSETLSAREARDGRSAVPSCRVCESTDTTFAFAVESTWHEGEQLRRFFTCGQCGTLLDATNVGPAYAEGAAEELTDRAPHVKFCLETSASVYALATFLCLMRQALGPRARPPRLLDVGTAFGFLVSMADSLGWDATGVEPAGLGRLGGKVLGVPVLNCFLEEAGFPQGSFDAVVSSEVVEHVTDPRSFMASVVRQLAPEGVLLLTTPNGELLRSGPTAEREWHEALAPGHHLNLLSPDAMTRLFHEQGLHDIRFFFHAGSSGRKDIVALAARRPGTLPERLDWNDACREAQDLQEDYLSGLVARREQGGVNDALYRGSLFRLVETLVGKGEYARASPYVRTIDELLRADGIDEAALEHFTTTGFDDYVARVPAFLGLYYHYRGVLQANQLGDHPAAARSFATAARLCKLESSLPFYARVGWVERANLHQSVALFRAGRLPEAIAICDGVLAARESVPGELLDEMYRQRILAHLERREYAAIRRFVTDVAGPGKDAVEADDTASPLLASLEAARAELREMAVLYREDRSALLRLNRMFDLLRRPGRFLDRIRAGARPPERSA